MHDEGATIRRESGDHDGSLLIKNKWDCWGDKNRWIWQINGLDQIWKITGRIFVERKKQWDGKASGKDEKEAGKNWRTLIGKCRAVYPT